MDSSLDDDLIPETPPLGQEAAKMTTSTPSTWRQRKNASSDSENEEGASIGDSPNVIPESESDGSEEDSLSVKKRQQRPVIHSSSDEESEAQEDQEESLIVRNRNKKKVAAIIDSDSDEEEIVDDLSAKLEKAVSSENFSDVESQEEEDDNESDASYQTASEADLEEEDDSIVLLENSYIPVNKKGDQGKKSDADSEVDDDSIVILDSSVNTVVDVLKDRQHDEEVKQAEEEMKRLHPREIEEMKKRLSEARKSIQKNNMLLSTTGGGVLLPDKGAKLKNDLESAKAREASLIDQLKMANVDISFENSPSSSSSGSIIISDEDRLNLLHKKVRLLRQQFAALGPVNQANPGGQSLQRQIQEINQQILKLEPLVRMKNKAYQPPIPSGPQGTPLKQLNRQHQVHKIEPQKSQWQSARDQIFDTWNAFRAGPDLLEQGPAAHRLYGGRMNDARRQEASMVTQDAMAKLHKALETIPAETDEEESPEGLRSKYKLYPHQKQGLAWLIWRESQHPCGGILADDMGLGKTLTLISLILKQKEMFENNPEKAEEIEAKEKEEWMSKKGSKNTVRSRATLIICPASLIGHWEKEVKSKIRSDTLSTLIYHGPGRDLPARRLAKYDMVITTYGTVQSEISKVLPDPKDQNGKKAARLDDLKPIDLDAIDTKNAVLLNIIWQRIILDEAHQIRNPRAKTSEAVCRLRAAKRWAVSGTPIQNEEKDMFSLIRFLRCSPFDEWNVWKQWVDKSPMGQQRMNTLVKSLLLRRTKDQKSSVTGQDIVSLPSKDVLVHQMKLNDEERKVYDEVFSFSRQAMVNYMKKHDEKRQDEELIKNVQDNGYKFRPDFNYTHGEAKEDNSSVASKFNAGSEIKAHHLLVLLLRLRQICNHPGLIRTMLEEETKANEGLESNKDVDDLDLVNQLANMSIHLGGGKNKQLEESFESGDMAQKILDPANPVFKEKEPSSKILTVIEKLQELKEKHQDTGVLEKAVIVSQWTSMLNIIKVHIKKLGFKVAEINGQIPVKQRGDIVDDFNRVNAGAQVMLLSLAAGGVGLNLVGANHLFLLDMHWNPQLEAQACDRIYRVGQKRQVTIHKFLCEDTVESRIQELQKKKMDLANSVLTGAKRTNANKLTLDDLKMLFDLNRKSGV